MISTRDLSELPDVEGLLKLHQSLATLDAILCPEWEFRYFSFNDHWDEGERLALGLVARNHHAGDERARHQSFLCLK